MGSGLLLLRLGDYGSRGGLDPPDPAFNEDLDARFTFAFGTPNLMRTLLDLNPYASLTAGAAWNGQHSSRSDHQRHGLNLQLLDQRPQRTPF